MDKYLKNKKIVIFITVFTIAISHTLYSITKELIYLKILPARVVYGKVIDIIYTEDVNGDIIIYKVKYLNKYLMNIVTDAASDDYNFKIGDNAELLVSKINPKIALYNSKWVFALNLFIVFFIVFFNIISWYNLKKNRHCSL